MRRLATVLAGTLLLGGCVVAPELSDDADALEDEVRGLPGVASVDVRYVEPVTLDSGKVEMTVGMEDGASAAQLEEVGRTVYDAFRTTHHDEEGDVDVTFDDSTLHLRSFRPEASTDVVVREWGLAHALAAGGSAAVEVMTQDVPGPEHVESDVVLTLGGGTDADAVVTTLEELEARYGADTARRGWAVAAADGSSLSVDRGFPGASTRDAWEALRAAARPAEDMAGVGVGLREFHRDGRPDRFVDVAVTGRTGPLDLDDPAVRGALVGMARAQVDLLVDGATSWSLGIDVDGSRVATVDPDLCDPDQPAEGALDEDLRTPRTCPGP